MKDEIAYIAGPYRAKTIHGIKENIRRAEAVALELWKREYPTICPHMNTRFFDGACPDTTWLEGDLAILARCDFVVLVPGWEKSSGAVAEARCAGDLNIPVYEWVDGEMVPVGKEAP